MLHPAFARSPFHPPGKIELDPEAYDAVGAALPAMDKAVREAYEIPEPNCPKSLADLEPMLSMYEDCREQITLVPWFWHLKLGHGHAAFTRWVRKIMEGDRLAGVVLWCLGVLFVWCDLKVRVKGNPADFMEMDGLDFIEARARGRERLLGTQADALPSNLAARIIFTTVLLAWLEEERFGVWDLHAAFQRVVERYGPEIDPVWQEAWAEYRRSQEIIDGAGIFNLLSFSSFSVES